jgi:predicted dehydrogenase
MKTPSMTRRDFVRMSAGAVAAGAAVNATLLEPPLLEAQAAATGRKIRFASIGTGIRGCDLLRSARQVSTGECVGIADLYDMHQKAGVEACGRDVPTTRDYRRFLDDRSIDAVIVATSDHLHRHIVLDAVSAGKDVYVEKPMSHTVADGFEMVAAVQAGKRILEVGSNRVSNILYKKAAEIYASGRLGEVHYAEAHTDRDSPSGAGVYPIPPDLTPETVNWKEFIRDAPPHDFDPVRFVRWRLYRDYGEGLAGDLFVHLLSGFMGVSGINTPPIRAYSTGGNVRYKDDREFPDVLSTLYDYPGGLTYGIHCNMVANSPEPLIFSGEEANLTILGNTLTITPADTRPQPERYGLNGWTEALRRQYTDAWYAAHTVAPPKITEAESYQTPRGYNDTADHLANFFHAIETREHVVEDEVFGNSASIACHMANYSFFNRAIATWDAATKTIKG